MHEPRLPLLAHAGDLRAVMEERVDQGIAGMSGTRVNHHSGGLVEDEERVVLPENG